MKLLSLNKTWEYYNYIHWKKKCYYVSVGREKNINLKRTNLALGMGSWEVGAALWVHLTKQDP